MRISLILCLLSLCYMTSAQVKIQLPLSHPNQITAIDVSPEESLAVTGDVDGLIKVWDPQTMRFLSDIRAHESGITDLKLVDDKILTSVDQSGLVVRWDLQKLAISSKLNFNKKNPKSTVLFPTGDQIAVGFENGDIEVWDLKNSKRSFKIRPKRLVPLEIKVSSDGKRLVIVYFEKLKSKKLKDNRGELMGINRSYDLYSEQFISVVWPLDQEEVLYESAANQMIYLSTQDNKLYLGPEEYVGNEDTSSFLTRLNLDNNEIDTLLNIGNALKDWNDITDNYTDWILNGTISEIQVNSKDLLVQVKGSYDREVIHQKTSLLFKIDQETFEKTLVTKKLSDGPFLLGQNSDNLYRGYYNEFEKRDISINEGDFELRNVYQLYLNPSQEYPILTSESDGRLVISHWLGWMGMSLTIDSEGTLVSEIKSLDSLNKLHKSAKPETDTETSEKWKQKVKSGKVTHLQTLYEGRLILTYQSNGEFSIYEAKADKKLVSFYLFAHGANQGISFVAITPEGNFDASAYLMNELYFVNGLDMIPLDELKDQYHQPGLLQEILGY